MTQHDHPKKKPRKTILSPWKDPESLFCDTEFLKQYLGKEVSKCKACKAEQQ